MKNMKITALCLSAAIALSTITAPVLASDDANRSKAEVKGQITVTLDKPDKSKDMKVNPGKYSFNFSDTKDFAENMAWAIKAIEKLGAKGILKGYEDKSFKPQKNVTNLEALTMILQLVDKDKPAVKYDKVHPALVRFQEQWNLKWGLKEVLSVAVDRGILLEEEVKGFNPNQFVKRHEFAKYLVRALGYEKEAEKNMSAKLPFKDANAIPKASIGYAYVVYSKGIMVGNENGQFKPNEPITRAEIAALIDKYLNDEDNDENEAKVVFKSYDEDRNRLYVNDNGKEVYYTPVENISVFKNNKIMDLDDLVSGDILDVLFKDSSSKVIIFIQVVGHVDEDEYADRDDIKFEEVSDEDLEDLPSDIQDAADSLKKKITKEYKAYEYDDEIYLAAFMGRKNTGGYSIEVSDVLSYKLSNGKYIVEAVVKETEPSKGSFVTQAITYPYSIVKFDSFENISKINFVDEDGKVIAQRTIEDLDEETATTGVFSKIEGDYVFIKVGTSSVNTKYELSDDVLVYVNNKEKTLDDLTSDMKVKLTIVNNLVTKISADYEVKEAEGTIQLVDADRNQIRVKFENRLTTYSVEKDAAVTLNGKDSELSELAFGMKAELELLNNRVIKIDAVDNEESFEGKITNIQIVNKKIKSITLLTDGTKKVFEIPSDTVFDMLDEDDYPTDLAINSIVEIKLVNGTVKEVIEL